MDRISQLQAMYVKLSDYMRDSIGLIQQTSFAQTSDGQPPDFATLKEHQESLSELICNTSKDIHAFFDHLPNPTKPATTSEDITKLEELQAANALVLSQKSALIKTMMRNVREAINELTSEFSVKPPLSATIALDSIPAADLADGS